MTTSNSHTGGTCMNIYDVYNLKDVVIEGIDSKDYPDFVDAYIAYATYGNGVPLTEDQLEYITENEPEFVQEMAHDSFVEGV